MTRRQNPAVVDGLSAGLGVALPRNYLDFLRQHNGGEGFVGDHYVVWWLKEAQGYTVNVARDR